MGQIAFFCRAKPQKADVFPICENESRVFIGYPLYKEGVEYNPRNLKKCLVDYTCSEEEWNREVKNLALRLGDKKNRKFCSTVGEGSIVVIPRPTDGVVHIGHVTSDFEIVDNPDWADCYLALRDRQGLDTGDHHIADVAMGWRVDRFRRVYLSRLPGWIRKSLLGRATYGKFADHPTDPSISAYSALTDIMEGHARPPHEWTLDIDEIKRRLVEALLPNSFEHLITSLLQLEYPKECWYQSGGPGDGGIDCFGADPEGNMTAIVQCKFSAGQAPSLEKVECCTDKNIRRYAAVLLPKHPKRPKDGTTEFLDLNWVADAVARHWAKLPLALSLRIGVQPPPTSDDGDISHEA